MTDITPVTRFFSPLDVDRFFSPLDANNIISESRPSEAGIQPYPANAAPVTESTLLNLLYRFDILRLRDTLPPTGRDGIGTAIAEVISHALTRTRLFDVGGSGGESAAHNEAQLTSSSGAASSTANDRNPTTWQSWNQYASWSALGSALGFAILNQALSPTVRRLGMFSIPTEIHLEIFAYLDIKNLMRLRGVSFGAKTLVDYVVHRDIKLEHQALHEAIDYYIQAPFNEPQSLKQELTQTIWPEVQKGEAGIKSLIMESYNVSLPLGRWDQQKPIQPNKLKVVLDTLEKCCELESLKLEACNMPEHIGKILFVLDRIGENNPKLKEVVLDFRINWVDPDFVDARVQAGSSRSQLVDGLGGLINSDLALTSLAMGGIGAGDEEMTKLEEPLAHNKTLRYLQMEFNDISSIGAKYLQRALVENDTLRGLDLSDNYIGSEGAGYIAEALRTNTSLTWLSVRKNCIGGEGIRQLVVCIKENANTQMTCLDLSENQIGDVGMNALEQMLSEKNTTLLSLKLECSDIDHEGACKLARALTKNDTLEVLDLEGNAIRSEGARFVGEMLRENKSLTWLNVANNEIDKEGICDLAHGICANVKTGLKCLDVSGNQIEDQAMRALVQILVHNKTLVFLDVGSDVGSGQPAANLTIDGVSMLLNAVANNTTLEDLRLSGLFQEDRASGEQLADKLLTMLNTNKTLISLSVDFNWMGDKAVERLIRGLPRDTRLQYLSLDGNGEFNYGNGAFSVSGGEVRKAVMEMKKILPSLEILV